MPDLPDKPNYQFADVVVPLNIPKALTYGIPIEHQQSLQPGMRISVSIGKNKQYSGVVIHLHNDKPEAYQVKPIKQILDKHPILNALQILFWKWMMQYYMATPGEVMQAALPAHLKLSGETMIVFKEPDATIDWSDEAYLAVEALEIRKEISISELRAIVGEAQVAAVLQELLQQEAITINDALEDKYKPKQENIVLLHAGYRDESKLHQLFDDLSKAPRQEALLLAFMELQAKQKTVKQKDLLERAAVSGNILKALVDKKVFKIDTVMTDRVLPPEKTPITPIAFTEAQATALEQIDTELKDKNVVLLHGVTGSGKTLLYIKKIKQTLAAGKQALLLLPEIGLTTQLVNRLYAYFGKELGVYHSRFSNNERVEIWEKVQSKQYQLIVGPRSALWLPYDKLGLIIVDEEHDTSYKQKDPAPRFHARDAAIYLASLHHAKVILGSATPSVESLYNSVQKKYGFVQLKERYRGVALPEIKIIDAKSLEQMRSQGIKLITPELFEEMQITLAQKKQVILFQNRRGYAPFQLCAVCGWVPYCNNCSVSLTYHKATDKLHCHYCGSKSAVIHSCMNCGSNKLISKSFGTERIEEEVQQLFPKATIARMDIDSMRGKNKMATLMEQLENQTVDILVGTQMVVKGLDFANVALVGILNADSLLNYPDFRVNERAFQLMEQVSGRAGRVDGKGKVLIQAHNTNHPVLKWVQEHNMSALYKKEIDYRSQFAYPPFVRLIKIIFKHANEAKCMQAAQLFAQALQQLNNIQLQGPAAALVSKVRNQYIREIWIKCPQDKQVLQQVKEWAIAQKQSITSQKGLTGVQIIFDVDVV